MKAVLITFFDIKVIVHFEFIPQGQTVNQAHYVQILKRLRETVCRKRPELWPTVGSSTMTILQLQQFLAQKSITELEHTHHSLHLAPNDFWLFSNIKSALKGRIFQDTEDIKKM
jgi:hypothetical protein